MRRLSGMGYINTHDGLQLFYEEYGTGDRIILSAQAGFYPLGVQQKMAEMGYHVYCLTLRGFAPSSYVTEDYGDRWYDFFAEDVVCLADELGIDKFVYMGASHGAGVGWHLLLRDELKKISASYSMKAAKQDEKNNSQAGGRDSISDRVQAFIAMVPGPHSLAEGAMSYRQMLMQGIITSPPPFDPPIDNDPARLERRRIREEHIAGLPEADPRERNIDYGRPLMRCGSEERLCDMLSEIQTPTLILGGTEDPISTPELMLRTAKHLPRCKLVMYSNCGHNVDTDITEELAEEADRFLKNVYAGEKWYSQVVTQGVKE